MVVVDDFTVGVADQAEARGEAGEALLHSGLKPGQEGPPMSRRVWKVQEALKGGAEVGLQGGGAAARSAWACS